MALFNSLRRASLGDQVLTCSDCQKREVKSDRIVTGLVMVQSGFLLQNYAIGKEQATIVFALCRQCCDRFTLTKVRWKLASLHWQWQKLWWRVRQTYRDVCDFIAGEEHNE